MQLVALLATFEDLGRATECSEQNARGLFEEGSCLTSPAEYFCLRTEDHHQEMSPMSQGLFALLGPSKGHLDEEEYFFKSITTFEDTKSSQKYVRPRVRIEVCSFT